MSMHLSRESDNHVIYCGPFRVLNEHQLEGWLFTPKVTWTNQLRFNCASSHWQNDKMTLSNLWSETQRQYVLTLLHEASHITALKNNLEHDTYMFWILRALNLFETYRSASATLMRNGGSLQWLQDSTLQNLKIKTSESAWFITRMVWKQPWNSRTITFHFLPVQQGPCMSDDESCSCIGPMLN